MSRRRGRSSRTCAPAASATRCSLFPAGEAGYRVFAKSEPRHEKACDKKTPARANAIGGREIKADKLCGHVRLISPSRTPNMRLAGSKEASPQPDCIRSAADMQGKLAPPSPIVGVKGRRLRLIALADPRYSGSDPFKQLAVTIRQTESSEDDFVLEQPPIYFDSTPLHERLLRHS